jgi:hypothetical protein
VSVRLLAVRVLVGSMGALALVGSGTVTVEAAPTCAAADEYVVVGVPSYRFGEGAVDVERVGLDGNGTAGQLLTRESLGLGIAGTGDRFGAAVEQLDANDDGCTDLIVGAPGVDGTGQAYLVFNSAAGFGRGEQTLTLPTITPRRAGDRFGSAFGITHDRESGLESGQTEHLTLWVGAPGRDVGTESDAGVIWEYDLDVFPHPASPDLALVQRGLLVQGVGGVPGGAEAWDRFGEVISDSFPHTGGEPRVDLLVVGIPHESVGNRGGAGAILTVPGPPQNRAGSLLITQNTAGVPGIAEAGDRFGTAVSGDDEGFVVGVPGEDIGRARDTGMVQLFRDGGVPWLSLEQNTPGVPGVNESGDAFGAAVAGTWMDTFIGVPGEDVGRVRDAGAIVTRTREGGSVGYATRAQGAGIEGRAETGDRLGAVLMTGDLNEDSRRVFIGVPGEDLDGLVDTGGVLVYRDFWHRVSVLPRSIEEVAGTRFGEVFGQNLSR